MTKQKLTATDRALIAMLTENTGRHMLDSGGAYGRNWERNQARDFLAEPATTLHVRIYDGRPEFELTHNVFHWLRERVDYDAHMTARFKRYAAKPDNKNIGWLALMIAWTEHLGANGLYGENSPMTVNTYNGEDLLSQVLQYVFFTLNDESYVLLQIHGGCDVRGGYTAPRVFRTDESSIFANAHATIREDMPKESAQAELPMKLSQPQDIYWTTDDGFHFYFEGAAGFGAGKQLETYEASEDESDKGNGKLYVAPDGLTYGPHGGVLIASF